MANQRKLAAIMFTDIEGYTALMQKSEQEAVALRDKHRKVFTEETQNHQGQILHYYGDGTLSVFDSAVKAVECAIAIQAAMREGLAVPLRIGIHSGDIVFTEDDVIGDGVNIASRIESLAVPGSILVSDKVYDEIKNHVVISTKFLKTFHLKNVSSPVGVYAIASEGLVIPEPKSISGKLDYQRDPISLLRSSWKHIWMPAAAILLLVMIAGYLIRGWQDNQKPSSLPGKTVAVVPLKMTNEEDYFVTGMTQGLISELSKVEQLTVIDQKTTKFYAGIQFPFVNLQQELPQVDYIVTGVLTRTSNQISANIELLVSGTDEPVWRGEYSSDISEIRKMWSEVALNIIIAMGLASNNEPLMGPEVKPVKPEIYELYLKGTYYLAQETPVGWQTGITYLHQAVDENPADAFAYAALADGYNSIGHGPAPSRDVFPKAREAALRAIQLDSVLAEGWAALSHYETYYGWNWSRAEQTFNKANQLNPNLAMNHFHRAWYLILFGRKEEAIKEHQLAEQLDPFSTLHLAGTGLLYSWTGQYEKALEKMDQALEVPGLADMAFAQAWKAHVLSDMGRHQEAVALAQKASEQFIMWRYVTYGPVLIKAGNIAEGRKIIAEIEQQPVTALGSLSAGFMYALLGDADNAIKWLSQPDKHGWYPWIRVWPGMGIELLHDDPRYLELLKEMNLPGPINLRDETQVVTSEIN